MGTPRLHVVDWADGRAREIASAAGGLIIGSSSVLELIAEHLRAAHQAGVVDGVEQCQRAVKRVFESRRVLAESEGDHGTENPSG